MISSDFVNDVLDVYQDKLMSYPNVKGVGIGQDPQTNDHYIHVMVERKIPVQDLKTNEIIPMYVTHDGITIVIKVLDLGGPITLEGE